MYNSFKANHSNVCCVTIPTDEIVNSMKINFVKLGKKWCEVCVIEDQHKLETGYDPEKDEECEVCSEWK